MEKQYNMNNSNINKTNPYWINLDVPQDGEHVYVQRQEEDIIIKYLIRGELVRIFNARKSGKSSVRNRIIYKLEDQNIKCVNINLLVFSKETTEEQFYNRIISEINKKLNIEEQQFKDWLIRNSQDIPATIKLSLFFDFLLSIFEDKIIIFIDEIDILKILTFSTDNFFACLRAIYQKRGLDFEYKRLNFCLLGVAKVSELIINTQITGFNFGRPIELKDFNNN